MDWDFYDSIAALGVAIACVGIVLDLLGWVLSPLGYISWWPTGTGDLELTLLGIILQLVGLAIFHLSRED